jgi:hypothetical protein
MENSFFHGKIEESVNNLKERIKELSDEISKLRESYNKERAKYIAEITELKTKAKFIAGIWGGMVAFVVAIASIVAVKLIDKFF